MLWDYDTQAVGGSVSPSLVQTAQLLPDLTGDKKSFQTDKNKLLIVCVTQSWFMKWDL